MIYPDFTATVESGRIEKVDFISVDSFENWIDESRLRTPGIKCGNMELETNRNINSSSTTRSCPQVYAAFTELKHLQQNRYRLQGVGSHPVWLYHIENKF